MDPDPDCPERLDPDPVNIRPDPQHRLALSLSFSLLHAHTQTHTTTRNQLVPERETTIFSDPLGPKLELQKSEKSLSSFLIKEKIKLR